MEVKTVLAGTVILGSAALVTGAILSSLSRKERLGWVDYYRIDENYKARKQPDISERKKAEFSYGYADKVPYTLGTRKLQGAQLFSNTSKLRAPSWSTPAGGSCPVLRIPILETVAAGNEKTDEQLLEDLTKKLPSKCLNCYATMGNYVFPGVAKATHRRLEWFNETSEKEVIDTLVDALKHAGNEECDSSGHCAMKPMEQPKYFRLFDSGDFNDARAVRVWRKVAEKLPGTKFWMPTTAHATCATTPEGRREVNAIMRELGKANKLPNVAVRLSAPTIGKALHHEKFTSSAVIPLTTGERKKAHVPFGQRRELNTVTIPDQDNKPRIAWLCPGDCTLCRMCWNKKTKQVAYVHHGPTNQGQAPTLYKYAKERSENAFKKVLGDYLNRPEYVGPG